MRLVPDAVFRSLADPTRRALFERLSREGDQTVWMLTDVSGVSQPAVSKHLAVLRRAGLVRASRKGRETRYRARPKGLQPLVNWMTFYNDLWRDRFDRLEDTLERMDK